MLKILLQNAMWPIQAYEDIRHLCIPRGLSVQIQWVVCPIGILLMCLWLLALAQLAVHATGVAAEHPGEFLLATAIFWIMGYSMRHELHAVGKKH